MSKTKRLLSMLLAVVMLCSSLAVGASAAYSEYKDSNIKSYDSIDQPVFTPAQLSSVALDAIDAMLAEIEEPFFKIPVINVTIRFSSIDEALDSLEGVYNGSAWATVVNIAGDLGNLQFKALNSDPSSANFAAEGVRRRTEGKTDLDVLYSIFQFLYDNRELLASYGYGTLDLGSTLTGIIEGMLPEFGAYLDAPNLIKSLLYDVVYDPDDENGYPEWDELSDAQKASAEYKADAMVQKLVDDQMNDLEASLGRSFDWGITMEFSGILDIDAPNFYDVFEAALQRAYNEILVPLGNTQFKKVFYELVGVESETFENYKITKDVEVEENGIKVIKQETIGYYLDDCADIIKLKTAEYNFPTGNSLAADVEAGVVKLNSFADAVDLNYTIEDYNFQAGDQFLSLFNNILKTWIDKIVRLDNVDWQEGSNDMLVTNLEAVARQILKQYGERYLSEWITIPSDEEIDALTLETGIVRFGRELIEKFAVNIILPDNAQSVRSILTYALCELIADKVPSEDIYGKLNAGTIDPNSDDGWKAIVAVIVRYYLNAATNINLPQGLTFDQTFVALVDWALKNYGGILDYAADLSTNTSLTAWEKLDQVIFGLLPIDLLPAQLRVLDDEGNAVKKDVTGIEFLLLDFIIGNVLDVKFEHILDVFDRNNSGLLATSPVNVVMTIIPRILNSIIPGLFPTGLSTIEGLLTNQKLGDLLKGLCTGLYEIRTNLIPAALPLVCMILELTTEQQLEDPSVNYPDFIYSKSRSLNGTEITIRNSSTGVNTAFRDASGKLTQDALYKVKIKSIKTNNNAVSVNYTADKVLNGGEGTTFPVTGSLSADGLVKFTISYEILNEFGASLTSSPIELVLYTYVSATHPDDDDTYYTYDEDGYAIYVDGFGMNDHTIVTTPAAYVTSWGQIKDQTYTIERPNQEGDYMPAEATVSRTGFKAVDANGTDVSATLAAGPFETYTTKQSGNIRTFDLLTVNVPKVEGTEDDEDLMKYIGRYTTETTLSFGSTDVAGGTPTIYKLNRTIVVYNDFGLSGIVSSVMDANRQKANYATSGTFTYVEKTQGADGEVIETTYTANASTAWNNYVTALEAAQNIVLKPKTLTTFDDSVYEDAAANLKRAAADLDACAVSAGVATLEALRAEYEPHNEEGVEYDNEAYNYMGAEDYVLYTWDRYKEHRDNMDSLINSQKVEEGQTAPTLKLFDITYRGHMYEMNANRLIRRATSKNYLQHAYNLVTNKMVDLDEKDYNEITWGELERAVAFADKVIADKSSDLRQTKVNRARQELIQAFKGLIPKSTEPADYTQLIDAKDKALAILDLENAYDLYEAEGLDALQNAYDAALEIADGLLGDYQTFIDEAAQKINDAIDALVRIAAGLDFTIADETFANYGYTWAPATADFADGVSGKYIYGLALEFSDGYESVIGTTGGAELEYVENENNTGVLGTGDTVTVAGTDTYTLVIFGDTNGDGISDSTDAADLIQFANWELDEEYGGVKWTAADIVADGCIDTMDISYVVMLGNYEINANQIPQDGTFSGVLLHPDL